MGDSQGGLAGLDLNSAQGLASALGGISLGYGAHRTCAVEGAAKTDCRVPNVNGPPAFCSPTARAGA